MSVTANIPKKSFFRVNEVCQLTDTQPYVLRFWESEFPQLSPDRGQGGKSVYKKDDIELIFRIKQLLYDEEYTIAGARQVLDEGSSAPPKARAKAVKKEEIVEKVAEPVAEEEPEAPDARPRQLELGAELPHRPTAVEAAGVEVSPEGISKERYDDAVEEISHLRLQLQELEGRLRRADHDREKAEGNAELMRDRRDRAIGRLESILQRLNGKSDAPA